MNAKEYQQWAMSKEPDHDQYDEVMSELYIRRMRHIHAALGIAGEAGEIVDVIKKSVFYLKPLDKDKIKKEVGDLMWYLAVLLDSIDSDFEEVMRLNHDKLEARFKTKFTAEEAIKRNDEIPGVTPEFIRAAEVFMEENKELVQVAKREEQEKISQLSYWMIEAILSNGELTGQFYRHSRDPMKFKTKKLAESFISMHLDDNHWVATEHLDI